MVIRSIGVASMAKMMGALYAAIGVLAGAVFALMALVGIGAAGGDAGMPAGVAAIFGLGAIVFMPILYGVMGVVGGAIGALVYNVFAGLLGGVELEVG